MKKVNDVTGALSLEAIYNSVVTDRKDHYKMVMSELIDVDFVEKSDSDTPGSVIVKAEGYVGQIINDSGVNVLVSIIRKDSFNPDKMRKARAMRNVAKKQQDFKL